MDKFTIKTMLAEALKVFLNEQEKESGEEKKAKKRINAEYAEILNSFKGLGSPNQADIMQLAGLGKKGDKTAESLFSKKLYKKKNKETGSVYMFNDEERASVTKAINTAKK
jgi:hypothetical protein